MRPSCDGSLVRHGSHRRRAAARRRLAAGTVNAVAGGGSLITFPTLVAIGLDQRWRRTSRTRSRSAPATSPASYGSRADLAALAAARNLYALLPTAVRRHRRRLRAAPGHAGRGRSRSWCRSWCWRRPRVLAFQQRLRAVVGHPREMSERRRAVALHALVGVGATYGGYFGAALGIMLVAGLGLVLDETPGPHQRAEERALGRGRTGTVVAFSLFGPVNWAAVAVVAPASMLGGYLGARLARRLPAAALRAAIVAIGAVISVYLLFRAF